MKYELKRLHEDGLDAAIARAEHYRLLNEPAQAESICLDVLELRPGHQRALVLLILARTDRFSRDENGSGVESAREPLQQLESDYERHYYGGLICERWAKALLRRGRMGAGPKVFEWLREAMSHYESAEADRQAGNDDPLLRWNACARLIMSDDQIAPDAGESFHPLLE